MHGQNNYKISVSLSALSVCYQGVMYIWIDNVYGKKQQLVAK